MSHKYRSEKEDPRSPGLRAATSEPAHVVWARQFPKSSEESAQPSTEEVFARQFPSKIPPPAQAARPTADVVWARQFPSKIPTSGKPVEPAHATWSRQFAAKVPTPKASAAGLPSPLGVRLSGIRGSASCPTGEIRRLIAAGGTSNLIQARNMVESLPADHPDGWTLVRAILQALCVEMEPPRPEAA